jgi:hypothetical protein
MELSKFINVFTGRKVRTATTTYTWMPSPNCQNVVDLSASLSIRGYANKKNAVFCDVALCRSYVNRRFGGTYRLHHQGTYLFTYAVEPFLRSFQLCSYSRTSQHFMEPEISLPCSPCYPPLVPILSQIDPVHTSPSYLSKIYFNIVHPPTFWSWRWKQYVPPKYRTSTQMHGITYQKIFLFIVTVLIT